MPIIIIESPNKREKIKSISGFDCEATAGHFMDLKDIEIENGYKAIFDYAEGKKSRIFALIEKCKNNEVYIATDPDREGYAIGYLFYEKIKNVAKNIYRAEFHEITPSGIKKGLDSATLFANTNFNYYQSFLGRRVADRLIGFILSPILFKELKAKSAGRVQTPALSLIVARDKEIKDFEKLPPESKMSYQIQAKSVIDGKEIILKHSINGKDTKYPTKAQAEEIYNNLRNIKQAIITNIESKDSTKSPPKPFTTSKLLKIASKKLNISTDETQKIAQELFEKGLITYIRTDSEFISLDFLKEMQDFYKPIYGDIYEYKEYKAGKNSQAEAHEAIRITHCHKYEDIDEILSQESLNKPNHKALYTLIFFNTLCSQLKGANITTTSITANIKLDEFTFSIRNIANKGYLSIFSDDDESESVSLENHAFKPNEMLNITEIFIKDIKKNPPSYYAESDFIEVLEKSGIGRPSTYASYIPKLLERGYIELDKKRILKPTALGIGVIDFISNNPKYNFVVDLEFTKQMEDGLDLIKNNECKYIDFIKEIHAKLDFIPLNTNSGTKTINPPSAAQIKFANSIAQQLKIPLPKNLENDWRVAKEFIDKNVAKLPKKRSNGETK